MKTANIEVYCDVMDKLGKEIEVFAVLSLKDESPDLPKFSDAIDEWAKEEYSHLEKGDKVEKAGTLKYEPNGEIISIEKK